MCVQVCIETVFDERHLKEVNIFLFIYAALGRHQ